MLNQGKVILLLLITSWFAHFFHFRDFGLYEDDYAFISDAMGRDASYLLEKLQYFVSWPQGRPIGFYLAALLAFVGDHIGGLPAIYLFGFFIVTLNTYLFYRVVRQNRSEMVAIMGGLAFCLFPADTTKILLTHVFILQTSLTFLLIATLCYLSNRKRISYLIILGSLLSYESAFMVFYGVPLLKTKWNKKIILELVSHATSLSILVVVFTEVRRLKSETRVMEMTDRLSDLMPKILNSMLIGPKVSLWQFLAAPFKSLSNWNIEICIVFVFFTGLFIWYFHYFKFENSIKLKPIFHYLNLKLTSNRPQLLVFGYYHQLLASYFFKAKTLLAALCLLCLGYSVAFTHYPPTAEYGRMTSVHLAATFGGSLFFACISSEFLLWAKLHKIKFYAITIISLYLALVVGYQSTVQLDFKQSWQNQRAFWTSVVANCPDLEDETVVLAIKKNLPTTKFIKTNSWSDQLVLKQIYKFPQSWRQEPRLFLAYPRWWLRIHLEPARSKLWVPSLTWPGYIEIPIKASVIVLKMGENRKLMRVDRPVVIQGKTFAKQKSFSVNSKLEKGVLYNYLITSPPS